MIDRFIHSKNHSYHDDHENGGPDNDHDKDCYHDQNIGGPDHRSIVGTTTLSPDGDNDDDLRSWTVGLNVLDMDGPNDDQPLHKKTFYDV
jgi:hypothetical protein